MSHWTILDTEIVDDRRLMEALDDLKIPYTKKDDGIYVGKSDHFYFKKEGKTYKLHHDFYYCKDLKEEDINRIMNRYNYRKTVFEARIMGFTPGEERIMDDGSVVFKLRRW